MPPAFDLQGHRGARGLKPENTLPSFEVAFDLGVTTVETDLHLTRDDVVVILHDPVISPRHCRPVPGCGASLDQPRPVRSLTLAELRNYCADQNPDPRRFPGQDASVTPLARLFAEQSGIDPFTPPTLAELFAFAAAYAGDLGVRAGKTHDQRSHARGIRFDLELKRVPFQSDLIGDGFDGAAPAILEQQVVAAALSLGVVDRTTVRSFDHRCVRLIRQMEPGLTGAVLMAGMAPIDPAALARAADAQVYCPEYRFLDDSQVQHLHAVGLRVVPWTVNDPDDWRRLLDLDVDGITTDFPDRLRGP